jgi:hypothetical protein
MGAERTRIGEICREHGFYTDHRCLKCEEAYAKMNRGKSKYGVMVNTDAWVSQGGYEHIDPNIPNMRFDSKKDLLKECEKRGLLLKCEMKPVSRGRGFEHSKR